MTSESGQQCARRQVLEVEATSDNTLESNTEDARGVACGGKSAIHLAERASVR
jgi:hypothetical protein